LNFPSSRIKCLSDLTGWLRWPTGRPAWGTGTATLPTGRLPWVQGGKIFYNYATFFFINPIRVFVIVDEFFSFNFRVKFWQTISFLHSTIEKKK